MITIHASCIALGRRGVLLLGAPGAGKSDLALRLIDQGARLVADDGCELFARQGRLRARAPATIAGLIEMRGQGIIALPHVKDVAIALAVRLESPVARHPEPVFYPAPKGLGTLRPIPQIALEGGAVSATARIRLALTAFSQGLFRDTFHRR